MTSVWSDYYYFSQIQFFKSSKPAIHMLFGLDPNNSASTTVNSAALSAVKLYLFLRTNRYFVLSHQFHLFQFLKNLFVIYWYRHFVDCLEGFPMCAWIGLICVCLKKKKFNEKKKKKKKRNSFTMQTLKSLHNLVQRS